MSAEPFLAQRPDRYLRWPRLSRRENGFCLHALAWDVGQGERTFSVDLDGEGQRCAGTERLGPLRPSIMGWAPVKSRSLRPTESQEPNHYSGEAAVDGWSVSIARNGYASRVVVTAPDGTESVVWSAKATAAAPSLAVRSPTEAAIAFHHNLREDTVAVDLAKWIAVRFISIEPTGVSVTAPVAPMPGRDRDLVGEEQSFEFPALVWAQDGSLVLLGRGSHCIYRQELGAGGWTRREALDNGAWGCRGLHLDAIALDQTRVLFTWRSKRGIEWRVRSTKARGLPERVPVPVEQRPQSTAPSSRPTSAERLRRQAFDRSAVDGRLTLFGDIQQHSAHSDGIGSAEEPYLRARHLYHDDFCALTDHESFLGKRTGPGEWAYLQSVADRFDEAPEFATLIAYEWTGKRFPGPGHKCVYLRRPGAPIISRDEVPEGRELVQRISQQGAITGPHHTGWTGADMPGHDPVGQPFWEICSCHGCYEYPNHPLGQRGDLHDQMVQAALDQGLRFGFIANSDAHGLLWHHGECRKRDPFRTGLTAVQASERSRGAIFDALSNRRCYATSGVPILLDFRVNGAPMGSELAATERLAVEARVVGTTALASVELVGPGGVLALASTDGSASASLSVDHAPVPYLYLRVTQEDQEMAWSSPVFVDGAGP